MTRLTTFILGLLLALPALAHEHWISQHRFIDPVSLAWCCDETDCFPQLAGAVASAPGGWRIVATGALIPFARTLPSQDGDFWLCGSPAKPRCFFAPPPGS